MQNQQPPQSEEPLHAALERIRNMAQTIVAELNNLLSDSTRLCTSGPEPPPDLVRAKEDLKTFRADLRERRQSCEDIGICAMEYLVREAQQILRRTRELGAEWPQTTRQSLADTLRQARTEAEKVAVWLIEFGLKDFLKRTTDRVAYLKKHPEQLSPWDAAAIRDGCDDLDNDWDEELKAKCADRLRDTRQKALEIAGELETTAHLNNIEADLHRRITSVLIIQRIREQMEKAIEFLNMKGVLTPQLQQRIRQGQERAARFRADKKLSDARVAEAGGRTKSAEMLKREAVAVLAMDWESFFPGETPP